MIYALIPWTDDAAWPNDAGFHTAFRSGWTAWLSMIAFDEVAKATDGHILMTGIAGWGPPRRIGTMTDGTDATSWVWNFRDLQASPTGQKYPHLWKEFVARMGPRQKLYRNLLAHVGAPYKGQTPGSVDELTNAAIPPIYDAGASIATGGGIEIAAALPFGIEPGGWPTGQYREAASYTLSDAFWVRRFTRPPTRADLWYLPGFDDPNERCYRACVAIGAGFSPTIYIRPNTTAGWGEGGNLSIKQVETLMRMAT